MEIKFQAIQIIFSNASGTNTMIFSINLNKNLKLATAKVWRY